MKNKQRSLQHKNKGTHIDWKVTCGGKYLWLGPRFLDWLQRAGIRRNVFFAQKAQEFPGLRFSPSTWYEEPREDVKERVKELNGYVCIYTSQMADAFSE